METYYLVDFENVHNEGMEHIDQLAKTDHVHIFYTENATNISLDIAFSIGVEMEAHKVPVRKQSLDMHLVSYLGYLIGKNQGKDCTYVIISKDTDYDNIIKFWKENAGCKNITRKVKIAEKKVQPKKNSTVTTKTQSAKTATTATKVVTLTGEEKSRLNVYVQHTLREKGYSMECANKVCSFVVKEYGNPQMLSQIHNSIVNTFGVGVIGEELYANTKQILAQYAKQGVQTKEVAKATSKSNQNLNATIQRLLANANIPNEVVNYVASQVVKYHGKENGKSLLNRALVQKYGQAKGNDYYNRVKKHM